MNWVISVGNENDLHVFFNIMTLDKMLKIQSTSRDLMHLIVPLLFICIHWSTGNKKKSAGEAFARV